MADLESIGEVFSADIVIVGGGPAGLIIANKVKELNSRLDVLIVDKATTGFSGGKANKGAGVIFVMSEDDDVDKFREFHVTNIGHYLNDQEMLEKFATTSLQVVEHFERWGIPIMREKNGKLSRVEELPLWSLCAFDLDMMDKLRKMAVRQGVRVVNKTQVVELLTEGDRVVGAVGFGILDGTYRIFIGKSVILASGSCNWMVTNMWTSGRGDGIAAAYRAGAKMRNAEFSNFYNLHLRGNLSAIVGGQYALYNNEGEYLAPKYCADFECDIDIGILLGMEKEVMEGKGPVRFEPSEYFFKNPLAAKGFLFKWNRPVAKMFWEKLFEKERKYTIDHAARPEVIQGFIGECSCIRVDHTMKTSLPGLWATGDTSHGGSGWTGAVPSPPGRLRGAALMYTGVSSLLAAQPAIDYAAGASEPKIDTDQVKAYKEEIYAPMGRKKGLSPRDSIFDLKEVVAPPRYSIRKSKDRLEEAIAKVNKIREQMTEVSPAEDWHMFGLCHDLRNMTQCADIYFNAALTRTESRGWHYREDFPNR
ncbi:MAG: FAD-binding protein [Peptococcaceae bacterium]|nr:FAD-binding protein [Peptococcaceae bacterium]